MASSATKRFEWLDAFRGLAACGIIVYHLFGDSILFFKGLYLLVDLFFVLSGFVLWPQIEKYRTKKLRFLKLRAIRLFPLVVLAIFFKVLLWIYQLNEGTATREVSFETLITIPAALLLLQIVFHASTYWIGPLWSLSAEWFANIIAINTRRWLPLILIGTVSSCVGLLIDSEFIAGHGPQRYFEGFGRGLTGFVIGLLVRKAFDEGRRLRGAGHIFGSLAVTLGLILLGGYSYTTILIAPFVLVYVVLVFAGIEVRNARASALFNFLGTTSYGVYLFHIMLVGGAKVLIGHLMTVVHLQSTLKSLLVLVVSLMLTISSAYLANRFYEVPIRKRLMARLQPPQG